MNGEARLGLTRAPRTIQLFADGRQPASRFGFGTGEVDDLLRRVPAKFGKTLGAMRWRSHNLEAAVQQCPLIADTIEKVSD